MEHPSFAGMNEIHYLLMGAQEVQRRTGQKHVGLDLKHALQGCQAELMGPWQCRGLGLWPLGVRCKHLTLEMPPTLTQGFGSSWVSETLAVGQE